MAQDLKKILKDNQNNEQIKMPENHEARFLKKLNQAMPTHKKKKNFSWLKIAASLVLLFGLSITAFKYFNQPDVINNPKTKIVTTKTLGDISPDLKKVEDYYLANINIELSKVKLTPENKELFDGYVQRLEELNNEYNKLSIELTNEGPDELTVNALINNLKFRLNLLYQLKEKLKNLNKSNKQKRVI